MHSGVRFSAPFSILPIQRTCKVAAAAAGASALAASEVKFTLSVVHHPAGFNCRRQMKQLLAVPENTRCVHE